VRFALVLIALGAVGGTWSAPMEAPVLLRRGGYTVVDAELHAHTRLSDGFLSPMELVLVAKRRGLDVMAVTEHNQVLPAKVARWLSRRVDGPLVLVGEEITSRDYHVLAYGLETAVAPRADLGLVLEAVHAQGGVAVAAHPVRRFWPAFEPHLDALDGVEVVSPVAFLPERETGFRWGEMIDFYERTRERIPAAIGSSDFHFFALFGSVTTHVFLDDVPIDRDERARAVLEALRAGRTVVRAPDGRLFGARDLVDLVARDPLPPPPGSPYSARSWLDGLSRVVGFLGALLLLLLRRRV
jgi:histidinol phosphatase-like PHP family hydrolase